MESSQLNWIAGYIWGIADDVLRDLYVRGKYRDVILPMTVLRRLDAVLEPTKQAVLDMKKSLDKAKITNQDAALRQASGQAFYNTSKFTLRDLRARASQQQLRADFEDYLDGFSSYSGWRVVSRNGRPGNIAWSAASMSTVSVGPSATSATRSSDIGHGSVVAHHPQAR